MIANAGLKARRFAFWWLLHKGSFVQLCKPKLSDTGPVASSAARREPSIVGKSVHWIAVCGRQRPFCAPVVHVIHGGHAAFRVFLGFTVVFWHPELPT